MEFIGDGLLALLDILVKLSLQGSFCILLVLAARFLLRKAPRWCSYVLWSVVFLRLICPVFPETSFSLMPIQLQMDNEFVFEQKQEEMVEHIDTGSILAIEDVDAKKAVADVVGNSGYQSDTLQGSAQSDIEDMLVNSESVTTRLDNAYAGELNALESSSKAVQRNQQEESDLGIDAVQKLLMVVTVIWLLGTMGLAIYHIVSYQLLKCRMKAAVETQEGICEVQGEHLSFVMGLVRPKIYLSADLDIETRKVILCHERVHLQRRDYLFKPLALGICCVHWWNPLVWLAFYLMNKDCEMSCDEKVVTLLGEESKTVYSYALLNEATGGDWFRNKRGSVCALLSFGEEHVKNRISHVLKYKKASIGVLCCAVLVIIVLGVGMCSNPKMEEAGGDETDITNEEQLEVFKEQEEALKKEIEKTKKEEALKAEQEALRAELGKVEKEQQEVEKLVQELEQEINTDDLHNIRKIYSTCEVGDITYQLTDMGIYQLDSNGLTFLYPAKTAVDAKLAYDNGKLYFPTDRSYYEGALDWADNSICVLDINTLEVGYIDLPQAAWHMFPLAALYVGDGYITLWKDDGFGWYSMLLQDVLPVYNGKYVEQLDEEEKNTCGRTIKKQVLENPNQIYCVGYHSQNATFTYLDLDNDGVVEEIAMTKNGEGWYSPMDSFVLSVGEWRQECSGFNQVNEIYAWSPDGEQILILLYEDGPSGDPMTTFYRYEDEKLCKIGTIASDVRDAVIENGIISTVIRQDVIQTDGIKVQYCINENGEVEMIEQETYDFTGLNDVELKEMLRLYSEPNGSLDITIMMKPQTVHITKTDKNFEWVLIEGSDGTKGWLRVKNLIYVGDDEVASGVIFEGLQFAG